MPKSANWLQSFLNDPTRVLLYCLVFLIANLLMTGSLFRLYGLHANLTEIQSKVLEEQSEVKRMQAVIIAARDPQFMARQARDQLELLEKDDLLFVFSEDSP